MIDYLIRWLRPDTNPFVALEVLSLGKHVDMRCHGSSMEPYYSDGDGIRVYPYKEKEPDVGDIVFFYNYGLNRHLIHAKWNNYYLIGSGDGLFMDGWIPRKHIFGYVIPHKEL